MVYKLPNPFRYIPLSLSNRILAGNDYSYDDDDDETI